MTARPVPVEHRDLLPEGVRPVADLLGQGAFLRLLEAHGGTRVSIPAKVGEFDPLAVLLSLKAARRLVLAYGPAEIKLPLCKHWRARLLRQQGHSYSEIGRRLMMNEQNVYRMLRSPAGRASDPSARQLRLEV